jgi:hypothetical protein
MAMWLIFTITSIGADFSILKFFQTEGILVEENKVLQEEKEESKRNWTWIVTEPLGGIIGGGIGVVIGMVAGALGGGAYADYAGREPIVDIVIGTQIGAGVGYVIGSAFGVWSVGKHIEKEDGSFESTLLGSIIGGIGMLGGILYTSPEVTLFTGICMSLPLVGSMVGYRLSIK